MLTIISAIITLLVWIGCFFYLRSFGRMSPDEYEAYLNEQIAKSRPSPLVLTTFIALTMANVVGAVWFYELFGTWFAFWFALAIPIVPMLITLPRIVAPK